MARGTFGRTYTFPVGKENRAGKFAGARAELLEGVFVPRCAVPPNSQGGKKRQAYSFFPFLDEVFIVT